MTQKSLGDILGVSYKAVSICKEYGTMLIKFDLTNMKMKIKYALDNNFITISHLSLYDNMILKIEK